MILLKRNLSYLATVGLIGLLALLWRQERHSAETSPMPQQATLTVDGAATTTPAVAALSTQPPTATSTPLPSPTVTHTPTSTPTQAVTVAPSATLPPPTPEPTALPLPTPASSGTYTLNVPIFMYHYVSTPPPDADKYRRDLSIEPEMLRQQLQYLADNGYTTIDFYDLARAVAGQQTLPEKPVILTFDDGYRDMYENAFPLLQAFDMTATFFIVTEFVDEGYDAYMTWEMLREMIDAGMRLEPHSKTHLNLTTVKPDMLIYQILGSQETLAYYLGYTPRFFAYPSGFYNDDAIAMLQQLDFWGAVTTQYGTWHSYDNRYEWGRVRVRYTTTLAEFASYLR